MRSKLIYSFQLIFFSGLIFVQACANTIDNKNPNTNTMINTNSEKDTAILGGGCFWCVEAIYAEIIGVLEVTSGYSGGKEVNPSYREVAGGITGHAEVVRVVFDPNIITYQQILEVFFATHDPTTLNRQGNDVGPQYRSVIFYANEEQREVAQLVKNEFATQLWDDPIVTEISPANNFYVAEDYHQDYFANNANQPYCRAVINPKVAKFKKNFSHLLKN